MEREYFDAKFEGLKALMESQQKNLHDHIVAVSVNLKRVENDMNTHKAFCPPSAAVAKVRDDLDEHLGSLDAHGRNATDKFAANIVAWVSLIIAVVVAINEIRRH